MTYLIQSALITFQYQQAVEHSQCNAVTLTVALLTFKYQQAVENSQCNVVNLRVRTAHISVSAGSRT